MIPARTHAGSRPYTRAAIRTGTEPIFNLALSILSYSFCVTLGASKYVPRLKKDDTCKNGPPRAVFYLFRPEGLTSKNLSFNLE
nr:MAG TPA: hypothetical protein [Bacteriophage sp.]